MLYHRRAVFFLEDVMDSYKIGMVVKVEALGVQGKTGDTAKDTALEALEQLLTDHGYDVKRIWWEFFVAETEAQDG